MIAKDWTESLVAGTSTIAVLVLLLVSLLTGHVAGIGFDQVRDEYRVVQTATGPKLVEQP